MLICDICGSRNVLNFRKISLCLKCFFYRRNINSNIFKISLHYDTYTPEIHKKISESHRNIYEFILSEIKNIFIDVKNKKVLEVGFGHGILLKSLLDIGFEVYGVDISKSAHDYAISIGLNEKNLYVSDFIKTNFKDSFDLIIMNQVLEEFDAPVEVFEKLKKLLKVGGVLVIRTKNSVFHIFASIFSLGVISYSGYSFKSLKLILKNNGFFIKKVSFTLSDGDPYGQFSLKFLISLTKKIITIISCFFYYLSFKKIVISPSFTVIAIRK